MDMLYLDPDGPEAKWHHGIAYLGTGNSAAAQSRELLVLLHSCIAIRVNTSHR